MGHLSKRPFDWGRECPADVARRRFPPIIGEGRGRELDDGAILEARRKLQGQPLTAKGETA
jgi:hypothetical protein